MKTKDLLYDIFEEQLLNDIPNGSEGFNLKQFATKVVREYLRTTSDEKHNVPPSIQDSFEKDLVDEVMEMTRKKIYGHPTPMAFRESLKNKKLK